MRKKAAAIVVFNANSPIIRDSSIHQQHDSPMSLATVYLDSLNSEQRRAAEHGVAGLDCATGDHF